MGVTKRRLYLPHPIDTFEAFYFLRAATIFLNFKFNDPVRDLWAVLVTAALLNKCHAVFMVRKTRVKKFPNKEMTARKLNTVI